MLYMIVNTHSAESCAFRSEDDAKALVGGFERFEQEKAPEHGVKILGSWINRPAHEAFVLADAPDAHAIDNALVESGVVRPVPHPGAGGDGHRRRGSPNRRRGARHYRRRDHRAGPAAP